MVRKMMLAVTTVAAFSMVGFMTPSTAEAGWGYGPGRYTTGYRGGFRGPVYRSPAFGGPVYRSSGYRGGFYSPYGSRAYYPVNRGFYSRPYSPGIGIYFGGF